MPCHRADYFQEPPPSSCPKEFIHPSSCKCLRSVLVVLVCPAFTFPLSNLFFQFLNYFIFVQLQLSSFSPHPSTPTQPNPPPSPASTLPLDFVHVSFIVVHENPSPHYPFPHSPLAIVRLFLTSMSLVIFCLLFSFVDYVPVKG